MNLRNDLRLYTPALAPPDVDIDGFAAVAVKHPFLRLPGQRIPLESRLIHISTAPLTEPLITCTYLGIIVLLFTGASDKVYHTHTHSLCIFSRRAAG